MALSGDARVVRAVDLVALTRVDVTGVPVRHRCGAGSGDARESETSGDDGGGRSRRQHLLELTLVHGNLSDSSDLHRQERRTHDGIVMSQFILSAQR